MTNQIQSDQREEWDEPVPEELVDKFNQAGSWGQADDEVQGCETEGDEPVQDLDAESGGAVTNKPKTIVLDGKQTIEKVAELHQHLLTAVGGQDAIDVDASSVKQIDTATLQLLVALKQTTLKNNQPMCISFPSERFIEAATLLGVDKLLEVDQVDAGLF